jgi:hypothetical protein
MNISWLVRARKLFTAFLLISGLAVFSAPVFAQDVTVPANSNLILDGSNRWIFHTPDNGSNTMYVAPWLGSDWGWDRFQFFSNGNLYTGGRTTHANNVKIFGSDEAWAEGISIVKASGWSGIRFTRNDPASGNYNGNWAIGYNYNTGNDFSISTNYNGSQYDGLFHISNSTRNIGIGTTGPGAKLHIVSDGLTSTLQSPNLGPNMSHIHWPPTGDWYIRSASGSGKVIIQDSGGSVGIGTSVTGLNAKVNVVGGALVISTSAHQADASLHVSTSFGGADRLTQINPSVASKPALNLMASTDASTNYNWWAWGVNPSGSWAFQPSTAFGGTTGMFIDRTGSVAINHAPVSGYVLAVGGNTLAERAVVKLQSTWPDFVFEKSYILPTLGQVKSFIDKHKHLPEIPSADEIKSRGIDVGEMNTLLLKKVEELTLYLIEQDKFIEQLKEERKTHAISNGSTEELTRLVNGQQKQIDQMQSVLNELMKQKNLAAGKTEK